MLLGIFIIIFLKFGFLCVLSCQSVLLFLSDCYCRITPYVKQLRGFKKVDLLPQETKEVTFELELCDFSFLNEKGQWEVEPGDFKVQIGNEDTILTLEQAYIL